MTGLGTWRQSTAVRTCVAHVDGLGRHHGPTTSGQPGVPLRPPRDPDRAGTDGDGGILEPFGQHLGHGHGGSRGQAAHAPTDGRDAHRPTTRTGRGHERVVDGHALVGVATGDPHLEGVDLESLARWKIGPERLQVAYEVGAELRQSRRCHILDRRRDEGVGQPCHPGRDRRHAVPPSGSAGPTGDERHGGAGALLARDTARAVPRTSAHRWFGWRAGSAPAATRHSRMAPSSVRGQRAHERVLTHRLGVELARGAVVRGDPERRGPAAQRLEEGVEMEIRPVLETAGARLELDQAHRRPLAARGSRA